MHSIRLELEDRDQALLTLTDASIVRPRLNLIGHLAALQVAGKVCAWLRKGAPERAAEPSLWRIVTDLLDQLDAEPTSASDALLAATGLQVLSALGWAFDFEQCVRCGTVCPTGKAAAVSAARGGLVCSSCGGAALRLSGAQRLRLAHASRGTQSSLLPEDAALALQLVDNALSAHADI